MPTWKQWLEPGRRLLAMFLALAMFLGASLLWLGGRLVLQDRALAAQRAQEAREIVADLAVASLQRSLAHAVEQMASFASLRSAEFSQRVPAYAATLPDDSLLIVTREDTVEVYPARLPFYPVGPREPGVSASVFANADDMELRLEDYPQALAALAAAAESQDSQVRAAALVRIARIHRKQSNWSQALADYTRLLAVKGAVVDGRPAELIGLQSRAAILEQQHQAGPAREAAEALLDDLLQRRFTLTQGVYEFYFNEARSILGDHIDRQEDVGALALASAVEALHLDLQNNPSGRRVISQNGVSMLALWRPSNGGIAALLLGSRWLEAQWAAPLKSTLASQRVALRLTGPDGQTVFGPQPSAGRETIRLVESTQLPWNLHAVTADSDSAAAASRRREGLLFAGMTLIATLLLAGAYLTARSLSRELALGRVQADFVSAVSHEFRTPLTSLCLLSEQLDTGRVTAETERREYYSVLARESQRLRRLVEGLLNFGRMEAGAHEYHFETVDPAELVQSVSREFERDAQSSGCRVQVSVKPDAPLVLGDRAALACAVWNLLENAVKYSPECLTVWADVEREDGCAAIHVRDHGVGISAEDQRRIFAKFVRGEAAKLSAARGTGIGLATVRQIVEAHQGKVRLVSKQGDGSCFTVLLPAVT